MEGGPVVVIGLDGATFDLWSHVDGDVTPRISRFLDEGVSSELLSTVPPGSAPGWPSIVTGVNPGGHGVFGFVERDGYSEAPVYPDYGDSPALWRAVSAAGLSSVFLNVPLTYPPKRVENGAMVSSLLTPEGRDWAEPPEVQERLDEACSGGYVVDTNVKKEASARENVEHLTRAARARTDAAIHLLEERDPDLLFAVYTGLDRLQHDFWRHLDEGHPGEMDPEKRELAIDYLEVLDRNVGRLLDALPEDADVLVVSDHGFGRLERYLNVNNWLIEKGYLKLKRRGATRVRQALHGAGVNPGNAYKLLSRLGLSGSARESVDEGSLLSRAAETVFLTSEDVDWGRTEAFSLGVLGWGPLYLNLEGREDQGWLGPEEAEDVRERLIDDLSRWTDPETGERVVEDVKRGDEIYSGPHADDAPDLIFQPRYGYNCFVDHEFMSPRVIEEGFGISGQHRPEGVIAAKGPSFDPEADLESEDPRVLDVAPTVLHLLGVPVGERMEGRVLDAAFSEGTDAAERPVERSRVPDATSGGGAWSDGEADEIRGRLEDIGYM